MGSQYHDASTCISAWLDMNLIRGDILYLYATKHLMIIPVTAIWNEGIQR